MSRPAATDPPSDRPGLRPWRAVGALYLGAVLAAMAAGLWPGWLCEPRHGLATAALPALPAVAAAQAAFFLLVMPLVWSARANGRLGAWAAEGLTLLVAGLPFYLLAGWVSDASPAGGVGAALAVASVLPLALAAGRFYATGRPGGGVLQTALLLLTVGLPWLYYVARDFLMVPAVSLAPLWHACPVLWAFSNAAGHGGPWPEPLWPGGVYLAAAAAVALAAGRPRKDRDA